MLHQVLLRMGEVYVYYDRIRRSNIKYTFSLVVAFIHAR